jgi:Response regulator of the LytR/AlgR family
MRILFCDDVRQISEQYEQILSDIIAKHKITPVVFEFYESGIELLKASDVINGDILFLDIHMPEQDGMEVARKLRAKGYQGEIIFLTVSKKHILDAFDVDAFNYLIKQEVDYQRIEKVFLEAYERITEKNRKYITLSRGGHILNVPIDSISYFEMKNRIINVHYNEGDVFAFYSTMDKVEHMLRQEGFIRVHRAYIVAVNRIVKDENGKVIYLSDGERIPIGLIYAKNYRDALEG